MCGSWYTSPRGIAPWLEPGTAPHTLTRLHYKEPTHALHALPHILCFYAHGFRTWADGAAAPAPMSLRVDANGRRSCAQHMLHEGLLGYCTHWEESLLYNVQRAHCTPHWEGCRVACPACTLLLAGHCGGCLQGCGPCCDPCFSSRPGLSFPTSS